MTPTENRDDASLDRHKLHRRLCKQIRAWQTLLQGDLAKDRELLELIMAAVARLPYPSQECPPPKS